MPVASPAQAFSLQVADHDLSRRVPVRAWRDSGSRCPNLDRVYVMASVAIRSYSHVRVVVGQQKVIALWISGVRVSTRTWKASKRSKETCSGCHVRRIQYTKAKLCQTCYRQSESSKPEPPPVPAFEAREPEHFAMRRQFQVREPGMKEPITVEVVWDGT